MISSRANAFQSGGISLVGIDMAKQSRRHSRSVSLPWIIICILGALLVVGMRIDLIRMGYAQADALAQEQTLRQEERKLTVVMRRLRNHTRLMEEASRLGFKPPSSIVDLPLTGLPQVASSASGAGPRP